MQVTEQFKNIFLTFFEREKIHFLNVKGRSVKLMAQRLNLACRVMVCGLWSWNSGAGPAAKIWSMELCWQRTCNALILATAHPTAAVSKCGPKGVLLSESNLAEWSWTCHWNCPWITDLSIWKTERGSQAVEKIVDSVVSHFLLATEKRFQKQGGGIGGNQTSVPLPHLFTL